ncbi:MAG: polysaccharide deacetylase family protein [Candidatus Omnitrophica bacterium]|nr:polysaccharide deacetylase family protein [Candidatus Omnitrophota bacterium]
MGFSKKFIVSSVVVLCVFFGAGSWISSKYTVPILMYHQVEDVEDGKVPPGDTVTPEVFEVQMSFLREKGYNVIRLADAMEAMRNNQELPHNSVVVTFDDGFLNNFTNAYPVLKKYDIPVTLFVAPGFMGRDGFLDWYHIIEMSKGGIEYGSHGMEQGYLPDLTREERNFELKNSKQILSRRLKQSIYYYAYPVGGFNDEVKEQVRQAGYYAAMTTNRGNDRFNKDLFEVNRIKMSNKDISSWTFRAKFSGYYNLFRKLKDSDG